MSRVSHLPSRSGFIEPYLPSPAEHKHEHLSRFTQYPRRTLPPFMMLLDCSCVASAATTIFTTLAATSFRPAIAYQ